MPFRVTLTIPDDLYALLEEALPVVQEQWTEEGNPPKDVSELVLHAVQTGMTLALAENLPDTESE